jgi:hypothetical protein
MLSFYHRLFSYLLILVCLSILTSNILLKKAHAQSAEEMGVVINLAGKQRMLTQKMSKEVMLIALNVDRQSNIESLKATSTLFDKTLKGLRDGDASLKLPATTSPRVLRDLGRVEKLWLEFYPKIQSIISTGNAEASVISEIANANLPLLKQMNKAVGSYEKEAAKGGLKADPAVATTINLSGKQRMLTQKMSKEFFLLSLDFQANDNRLNLLETLTLFERTLVGLKVGDDSLGLPGTNDAAIIAQLDIVSALWAQAKPAFVSASQGKNISTDDIKKIANANLPLLKEMNKAVGMFELLAKS